MTTRPTDDPLTRREFYDAILPNLATKADLAELKAELRGTLIQVALGLAGLQLVWLGAVAAIIRFLG